MARTASFSRALGTLCCASGQSSFIFNSTGAKNVKVGQAAAAPKVEMQTTTNVELAMLTPVKTYGYRFCYTCWMTVA
jgi:hypothetical protein